MSDVNVDTSALGNRRVWQCEGKTLDLHGVLETQPHAGVIAINREDENGFADAAVKGVSSAMIEMHAHGFTIGYKGRRVIVWCGDDPAPLTCRTDGHVFVDFNGVDWFEPRIDTGYDYVTEMATEPRYRRAMA